MLSPNFQSGFSFGIPEAKIDNKQRLAYSTGVAVPEDFVVDKVLIKVVNGVKGAKIDIGIESDTAYLVKGIDVSQPGIISPGKITDKNGNIVKVTYGGGLCNVFTDEVPSSTGKSTVTKVVGYDKIMNATLSGKMIYIVIPAGCGKENPEGALKIVGTVTGYRV